jgi:hypothetical protein
MGNDGMSSSSEEHRNNESQATQYSLIMSWFESKNIRSGNPEEIGQVLTCQRRGSIRSSPSLVVNNSSLLARRKKPTLLI